MKRAILLICDLGCSYTDYKEFIEDINHIYKIDVHYFSLNDHEKKGIRKIRYKDWLKQSETFLVNLCLSYDEIFIIGHGVGAIIGCYLSSKYNMVRKLVLLSPLFITSFTTRKKSVIKMIQKANLCTMCEVYKMIKEKKYVLTQIRCPLLLIHGQKDLFACVSDSFVVLDTVESPKYFIIIKDGDHQLLKSKEKNKIEEYMVDFFNKKRYKKRYNYKEL